MTKRYIITTAVNNTKVHPGFWSAIQQYAKHNHAEIRVVGARYKNPTSKAENRKVKSEDWYATQVLPYLTRKEERLSSSLTLFADIPAQPTASNPLAGLEVYASETSGIIGHVKRQMVVIPTDHRQPRVLWSTGACTVAKYSRSRAGARAKRHHVLGAVIVEVVSPKRFFVRNVTANRDGSFTDLRKFYAPTGVSKAANAVSVTAGDIHVGQEDEDSLEALEGLVELLEPRWLVLHDVLDFDSRSHHRQSPTDRFARRFDTVEAELEANAAFYARVRSWMADNVVVVESNHHEHLMRWLREFKPDNDIINAPTYHRVWAELYAHYQKHGKWPNAYEREMQARGVEKDVLFLGREDSFKLLGVEHSFHGDIGVNGSRGSIRAYSRLGVKCTIGHSHTPGILDGVFQTGVTGKLDMSYNNRPSTWLQAHVVLHADGKRQMVITQQELFCASA